MLLIGLLDVSGFFLFNASACTCLKWKVAGTCRQVTAKRTNVPGMKGYRGPYGGFRPRRPYGYVLYRSRWAFSVDFILIYGMHVSYRVCSLCFTGFFAYGS
jgi:hypothetical protein